MQYLTTWENVAKIVQDAIDRKLILSQNEVAFYESYKDLKSYIDTIRNKSKIFDYIIEVEQQSLPKKTYKFTNIQTHLWKPIKVYSPDDIQKYKLLV